MNEPGFKAAYARGLKAAGQDYFWHWRVHVGLWAARLASGTAGDFVECGVNRGFLSSAIMQSLDWDSTGRTFFLLDTFRGIDATFITEEEARSGIMDKNQAELDSGFYTSDVEQVRQNFSEWQNKRIIAGAIPNTLPEITAEKVAFLHIDMNCSPPEVAALNFLWDRIPPGGVILFDDYAYHGFRPQKIGIDGFASQVGCSVLSLPTGQGLLIKPGNA
ncbi:MAG: methyltransferase [Rhizobiales bacterium PAR1]|nr:MAG: methyltransferase [Rhizobiales bacterium PAR1]